MNDPGHQLPDVSSWRVNARMANKILIMVKNKVHSIAVFCGSSPGSDPEFAVQAGNLGQQLARRGVTLVFGGSAVGLMLALADAVIGAGGKAIGVMPQLLYDKGIAHPGLSELIVVDSMHQRKMRMNELCDGVIVLPGGFGTLDECFEMITWAQLGIHQKPIALLNVNGYYDHLLMMLDHMVRQSLLKAVHRDMLIVSSDLDQLLDKMEGYIPQPAGKWIR